MTRLIAVGTTTAAAIFMAIALFANFAAAPRYELLIWIAISSALASMLCLVAPPHAVGSAGHVFSCARRDRRFVRNHRRVVEDFSTHQNYGPLQVIWVPHRHDRSARPSHELCL